MEAGFTLHDCDGVVADKALGGYARRRATDAGVIVRWTQHDRVAVDEVRGLAVHAEVQAVMNDSLFQVLQAMGFAGVVRPVALVVAVAAAAGVAPIAGRGCECGAPAGYARRVEHDQQPQLQGDELTAAGCWKLAVLADLRPGDTLVVWRLDRLGRSLRHLIDVMTELDSRGVGFRSLRESIDTTTPAGRLVFHLFASLAQFERELVVERTKAGLSAARARGRKGGRPPALSAEQVVQARRMYDERELTVEQIAKVLGVGRPASTGRCAHSRAPPVPAPPRPRGSANPRYPLCRGPLRRP